MQQFIDGLRLFLTFFLEMISSVASWFTTTTFGIVTLSFIALDFVILILLKVINK